MNILQFLSDLIQPPYPLSKIIVIASLMLSVGYALVQHNRGLNSSRGVTAYLEKEIKSQSTSTALMVGTASPTGNLDVEFSYNANTSLPLASTIKIVVLAAYAQRVAEGSLDARSSVSTSDWEAYYYPFTDGGAHMASLELFGISADNLGFAKQEHTVTLNDLANVMIRFSDNAATDYLIDTVGEDILKRVIEENELTGQDMPLSILGTFLAWQNHITPEPQTLTKTELAEAAQKFKTLYLKDSSWRKAQLDWLQTLTVLGSYESQAALAKGFSGGSVADYARIMAGVVTETFISPEVSQIMQPILEWPMDITGQSQQFETFGAKGGSLQGVMTDASYMRPTSGKFAGQNRVVVLFLNDLSEQHFNNLSSSSAFDDTTIGFATNNANLKPLLEAQQALE